MDVIPYHAPGEAITGRAASPVTGGRFVSIAGDQVGDETGALTGSDAADGYPSVGHRATQAVGVAARDADTDGAVLIYGPGHVLPVEAGGAIAAGADVTSDADGRAVSGTANGKAGVALSSAAAAGDTVKVWTR